MLLSRVTSSKGNRHQSNAKHLTTNKKRCYYNKLSTREKEVDITFLVGLLYYRHVMMRTMKQYLGFVSLFIRFG